MSNITGGTVRYENGTKASEEYAPPKKAAVELRFDIADEIKDDIEAVEAAIAKVAAKAQALVHEMLGSKVAPAAKPAPTKKATPVAETAHKDAAKAAYAEKAAAEPKAGAADMGEFDVEPQNAAAVEEDLTTASATPVSDADLTSAVTRKNEKLKDATQIRDLIRSFNPDPTHGFQLKEIPQAQRRTFLEKLGALKPK